MKYDSIIVGAGTAGIYFARELAKNGLKVLVIEKEKDENIANRLDIIHFPVQFYDVFDIEKPDKDSSEFAHEQFKTHSRSAKDNYEKTNTLHFYAVHLPLMNKRLRDESIKYGVEYIYEASFKEFIRGEDNNPIGIKYIKDNTNYSVYGSLIADATGIEAYLRRSVNSPYMEDYYVTNKDRFYVVLKYVIYNEENSEKIESCSWPFYKTWIGPCNLKNGRILGVGASTSYNYAKHMMEMWENKIKRPEYAVDHFEYGCVPYCRSPYSFVSNNFICLGDAACLTNPMNGEGLIYQFYMIQKALPTILEAFKNDDLSAKSLWNVNKIVNSTFINEISLTRAFMIGIVKMNEKENDYMYKNAIIFKDENEPEGDMLKFFMKGTFTFNLRLKTVGNIGSQASKGLKIKKLYEQFPENIDDYFNWKDKADKLWAKIGKISDLDKDSDKY